MSSQNEATFFREIPIDFLTRDESRPRGETALLRVGFRGPIDAITGMVISLPDVDLWLSELASDLRGEMLGLRTGGGREQASHSDLLLYCLKYFDGRSQGRLQECRVIKPNDREYIWQKGSSFKVCYHWQLSVVYKPSSEPLKGFLANVALTLKGLNHDTKDVSKTFEKLTQLPVEVQEDSFVEKELGRLVRSALQPVFKSDLLKIEVTRWPNRLSFILESQADQV